MKLPESWKERREKRKEEWKELGKQWKGVKEDFKKIPSQIRKENELENRKPAHIKEIERKSLLIKIALVFLLPLAFFLSWLFYPSTSTIVGVWIGVVLVLFWKVRELKQLKEELK